MRCVRSPSKPAFCRAPTVPPCSPAAKPRRWSPSRWPVGPVRDPPRGDRVPAEVALVGYQDQGNLGMGYLAAVLQERGHIVQMIDVRDGPEKIAERLASRQPLVVGFSLIFQVFLPQFRRVASHLRALGVTSHFTIGGHFPSLCHDEVLAQFPEL